MWALGEMNVKTETDNTESCPKNLRSGPDKTNLRLAMSIERYRLHRKRETPARPDTGLGFPLHAITRTPMKYELVPSETGFPSLQLQGKPGRE